MSEHAASPPEGPIFGPASSADAPALAAIDADAPQPWGVDAFRSEMERDPPGLFTLRESGKVVGFAVVRIHPPEMDIVNLAVAPPERGHGLGRLLLKSVIAEAARLAVETVFLEVRESNRAARALYESAGFEPMQRRPGFYRQPLEDALVLRLSMSRFSG